MCIEETPILFYQLALGFKGLFGYLQLKKKSLITNIYIIVINTDTSVIIVVTVTIIIL